VEVRPSEVVPPFGKPREVLDQREPVIGGSGVTSAGLTCSLSRREGDAISDGITILNHAAASKISRLSTSGQISQTWRNDVAQMVRIP
jgi:hypothetical protein